MSGPDFLEKKDADAKGAPWPVLTRLSRRLSEHRRRLIRVSFVKGALQALCLQLFLLPILGWVSSRQPYQTLWLKIILATYALYLWPFFLCWLAALRPSLRRERLAEQLDHANPGSPDVFQTLLSLENHTPEILAALDRFYADWESRLRVPRPAWIEKTHRRWLLAALVFSLALPLFSRHYGEVVYRMGFPVSAWENIPVPELSPIDSPERAALGDTLRMAVQVENLPLSVPVYAILRFHGLEERYPLEQRESPGNRDDTAWFTYGPVEGDLSLHFSALNVETSEHSIHAVPPPSLQALSAVIYPPSYTRLPPESLSDAPAVLTLLPGSHVVWRTVSVQPLRKLIAIFKAPDSLKADTLNLGRGREFSFRLTAKNPIEFRLGLFTEDGLAGSAGPYRLERGVDAPPEVALLTPLDNGELARSLKIPIAFRAHDDFGVSSVVLHYSVLEDGNVLSQGSKDIFPWMQLSSGLGEGLWDIGDLPIRPGGILEIYLEAADNDIVSGPKTARSATVRLHMPSLEEVVSGMDAGEHSAITSLKSAAEREEQVRNNSQPMASQDPANAPPPLGPWEVRRILSSAPQDHLQRLERHLEAEAAQANPEGRSEKPGGQRDTQLGKQLESLRREAKDMEKRLPPQDAWQKPLAEQQRWLDTLMRDQQKLDRDFSKLGELKSSASSHSKDALQLEPLAQERKALQEELQRNRKDQKDLEAWMQDQQQQMNVQKQTLNESQQAEARAREDVQQALSQMKETLQKGMENGALSPDLLEKMQRIQELLKEALPDSTLDRLKQQAENQQVGVEDLQRSLKDLLDKKEDASQNLDRAIRMLEMLRDMRGLEDLSQDLHSMQSQQEQLADQIGDQTGPQSEQRGDSGSVNSPEKLQSRQSELRQSLEKNQQELNSLAQDEKLFRELKNETLARQTEEQMQATENALKRGSPNASQARKSAKSAANGLKRMAAGMDDLLGRLKGGPDAGEVSAVLDETLEFGRWLELIRDKNQRRQQGWEEEDAALNQRGAQMAHWLSGRMENLAARRPFESEVLRREAAAMGFQADALLTVSDSPVLIPASLPADSPSDSLLAHTRRAARELLKWLQQAQDGDGSMGSAGDNGSTSSQGDGNPGDDEGLDGLAGRLRGISGKQMAVNQATYQLLRSMLEGRRPAAGSQDGSMPFPGESSGSSAVPGEEGSPLQQEGSSQNSGQGSQQSEGGNSSGDGGANGQQGIAESLERMAESADDAGGAARKLRELAEEARELEKDLRQGELSPEEVRQRQEGFQTRLLEATNALEERGQDRQRQAEAYLGGALKSDSAESSPGPDVYLELRRREEWARGFPLPPEQKRRLESYYETLLTH